MKGDIKTRKDIDDLMNVFYKRVMDDKQIGYIFTKVARLDLEKHLPVIGDFWESLLLGGKVYQKHGRTPLQIHGELSEKTPLEPKHFRQWLEIFCSTIDEMFEGDLADFAKFRADAIAARMMNYVCNVSDIRVMSREIPLNVPANRE
jgi:hemoglobin